MVVTAVKNTHTCLSVIYNLEKYRVYLIPPTEKEAERIQHLCLKPLTVVLFSVSLSKKKDKKQSQKNTISL